MSRGNRFSQKKRGGASEDKDPGKRSLHGHFPNQTAVIGLLALREVRQKPNERHSKKVVREKEGLL